MWRNLLLSCGSVVWVLGAMAEVAVLQRPSKAPWWCSYCRFEREERATLP